MRIRIFFFRFPTKGYLTEAESDERFRVTFEGEVVADAAKYEVMVDRDVPPGPGADDIDSVLGALWKLTQNDFFVGGWRPFHFPAMTACRSSMVGDIFCVDGACYVIARIGFNKVPDDVAKVFLDVAKV